MFKLYELTEVYKNIWDLVGDDEQDLTTLETALKQVEDNIEIKAENIAKLMKSIDADAEVIKIEEQRLAKRRKALENKREGMKSYLEAQLKEMGVDKVQGTLISVRLQKNPPSVNVLNESLIPEKYWKTIVTKSLDKKSMLDDLKADVKIKGAEIKQEKSLRIS